MISFCLAKASLIVSTKNISVFGYKVVNHLTSWPLNELVKLTMLWTTGPRWCVKMKKWLNDKLCRSRADCSSWSCLIRIHIIYSSLSAPILRVYGNQLRIENLSASLDKEWSTTLPFPFLSPFHIGSTLRGNNLPLYSFQSRPHFWRPALSREANRKLEKCTLGKNPKTLIAGNKTCW